MAKKKATARATAPATTAAVETATEETKSEATTLSKSQTVESIDPNLLLKKMMTKNSMPGKSISSKKLPNQGK